ncbi:hypothetical protein H6P81_006221 [Aristolochia fimbriata]|uniref:RNase H type-1 domain-containing protein n=1 Tax=Aristolochia fimbriata TaxID=158543 RepID=A0AAV7F0L2_ARIFI|nr:hypothetical protein H6P81_006221 [Aristolochia fimbriata]
MLESRNISELKSFQGHLAFIRRFISNLASRCQPFSRLMKKNMPFQWDDACRNAFNCIKVYLIKPPVLVAPIVGKPLLLYITAQENSVGALLPLNDENNKERSLYYLSQTLVGAELNYTPIEKTRLALIFAVQKLRHYLLAHSTNLISRADMLKAIKGQALENFLADHPVPAEWELTEEFPDEEIFLVEILSPWKMYFGGAARRNGAGAGVLFVLPKDDLLPYSFVLTQNCSNNVGEYEGLLLGLGIAVEMEIPQLEVYDDSTLVIKQITGEFEVKKIELLPFWKYAGDLLAKIPQTSLHYIPCTWNGPADALAGIIASLAQLDNRPIQAPIYERWVIPLVPLSIEEEAEEKMKEEEASFLVSITKVKRQIGASQSQIFSSSACSRQI